MKAEGLAPAAWVNDMLAEAKLLHYKRRATYFYNIPTKSQTKFRTRFIHYSKQHSRKQKVWSNSGGYHRLRRWNLELRVPIKMNTIGGDVLQAINKAIDLSEKEYQGLVIGNQAEISL
jgi:3-hydroxyacyl-CoA dehydrogenase